jgi:DNA primase
MESRVAFVGTFWQKYTLAAVCHPIRTRGWWPKEGITKLDVIRYYADIEAFGQTIVAPYAVWRRPHAPVSTPLAPDEVDPKLDPARYTCAPSSATSQAGKPGRTSGRDDSTCLVSRRARGAPPLNPREIRPQS